MCGSGFQAAASPPEPLELLERMVEGCSINMRESGAVPRSPRVLLLETRWCHREMSVPAAEGTAGPAAIRCPVTPERQHLGVFLCFLLQVVFRSASIGQGRAEPQLPAQP